jgi:hypothetical protein
LATSSGNPDHITTIHQETPDSTDPNPEARIADVYVDDLDRVHALMYVHGAGTGYAYQGWHLRFNSDGTIASQTVINIPYQNFARMTQDTTGRYWFWTIVDSNLYVCSSVAGNTDGTVYTAMSTLPLSGGYATTINDFAANPRHGTEATRRDYADIITDGPSNHVYLRLAFA